MKYLVFSIIMFCLIPPAQSFSFSNLNLAGTLREHIDFATTRKTVLIASVKESNPNTTVVHAGRDILVLSMSVEETSLQDEAAVLKGASFLELRMDVTDLVDTATLPQTANASFAVWSKHENQEQPDHVQQNVEVIKCSCVVNQKRTGVFCYGNPKGHPDSLFTLALR